MTIDTISIDTKSRKAVFPLCYGLVLLPGYGPPCWATCLELLPKNGHPWGAGKFVELAGAAYPATFIDPMLYSGTKRSLIAANITKWSRSFQLYRSILSFPTFAGGSFTVCTVAVQFIFVFAISASAPDRSLQKKTCNIAPQTPTSLFDGNDKRMKWWQRVYNWHVKQKPKPLMLRLLASASSGTKSVDWLANLR